MFFPVCFFVLIFSSYSQNPRSQKGDRVLQAFASNLVNGERLDMAEHVHPLLAVALLLYNDFKRRHHYALASSISSVAGPLVERTRFQIDLMKVGDLCKAVAKNAVDGLRAWQEAEGEDEGTDSCILRKYILDMVPYLSQVLTRENAYQTVTLVTPNPNPQKQPPTSDGVADADWGEVMAKISETMVALERLLAKKKAESKRLSLPPTMLDLIIEMLQNLKGFL